MVINVGNYDKEQW